MGKTNVKLELFLYILGSALVRTKKLISIKVRGKTINFGFEMYFLGPYMLKQISKNNVNVSYTWYKPLIIFTLH